MPARRSAFCFVPRLAPGPRRLPESLLKSLTQNQAPTNTAAPRAIPPRDASPKERAQGNCPRDWGAALYTGWIGRKTPLSRRAKGRKSAVKNAFPNDFREGKRRRQIPARPLAFCLAFPLGSRAFLTPGQRGGRGERLANAPPTPNRARHSPALPRNAPWEGILGPGCFRVPRRERLARFSSARPKS